jgi:hypothetical protein
MASEIWTWTEFWPWWNGQSVPVGYDAKECVMNIEVKGLSTGNWKVGVTGADNELLADGEISKIALTTNIKVSLSWTSGMDWNTGMETVTFTATADYTMNSVCYVYVNFYDEQSFSDKSVTITIPAKSSTGSTTTDGILAYVNSKSASASGYNVTVI